MTEGFPIMKYYREDNYLKGLKLFDQGAEAVIITNNFGETKVIKNVKGFKFYYRLSYILEETIVEVTKCE
jgi:hypothetical protein